MACEAQLKLDSTPEVVVDGISTSLNLPSAKLAFSFAFSPDSQHFAYEVFRDPGYYVVLDGQPLGPFSARPGVLGNQNLVFTHAMPPSTDAMLARTWTDRTGKYSTETKFIKLDGENVRLLRPDGTEIAVPLERLSASDRSYITGLSGLHLAFTYRCMLEVAGKHVWRSIVILDGKPLPLRGRKPHRCGGIDFDCRSDFGSSP